MEKEKLLFVGAFKRKGKEIYGGQLSACEALLNSPLSDEFQVIKINSTQLSNPPPNILIRLVFSFYKLASFVYKAIAQRPSVTFIFFSSGLSAIEKGIMARISLMLGSRVFIFPRAGLFIDQCQGKPLFRAFMQYLYRDVSGVICQGDRFKKFFEEDLQLSSNKTHVVQNWTASKDFIDLGKAKQGKDTKPKSLIYVAWVEEHKGILDLIKAVTLLHENGHDFNLTVVGDGNSRETAEKMVSDNGLSELVTFLGWCNKQKLKQLLGAHDIFVLPSYNEGFPNSLIEAGASGLPAVVTSVGSIPDFMTHGIDCFLVEPKDISSMSESISKLLTDNALYREMSGNIADTCADNFSVTTAVDKLFNIIQATRNN